MVLFSVSFHQDSIDAELGANVEKPTERIFEPKNAWKVEDSVLALPLLQLPQETETAEVPLTDREKRCLVVPICDLRDKKRRLLRARSAGPRLM